MSGIHQEIDMRDAERQFEAFFASLGIPLPRYGLKLDGRIHRFQIGDRPNSNGAYQFWPEGRSFDGRPHGWVQNWSDGDTKHRWQYKLERGFIIVRHDGSIHNTAGYDALSGAYYDEIDRVEIPEHPTRDDAARAAGFLCNVLCDFPFAGADDCDMHYQSNMIGFIVSTAFLFADIGHIPMLVIDAPRRGTGKTLLTQVGAVIMTGEPTGTLCASSDDDDWRKLLTSSFKDATPYLAFDNVGERVTVDSPSLAMALTTGWFADRLLRTNTKVRLKRRCIMVLNGNNIKLGPDIRRRTYRVRIDDGNVSSSDARKFIHPERVGTETMIKWLKRERSHLLSAVFTMVRAWQEAGRPKWGGKEIESFEEFCRVIGGVLQYAGLDDFLRDAAEDQSSMGDDDEAQWGAFLSGVYEWTREVPFTAKMLVAKCRDDPDLAELIPDRLGTVADKRFNAYTIGSVLGHKTDNQFRCGERVVKLSKTGGSGRDKNEWIVKILHE